MEKKLQKILCPLALTALTAMSGQAREVARFPMENSGDRLVESVSGAKYVINSKRSAENVPGAVGSALRFDGYSTYIDAKLGTVIPAGSKQMTASVWFALETYPIVEIDMNTTEQVAIASCLDDAAKTGFGFFVGFDGKYSFKTYMGGWPLELRCDSPIQPYEWVNLTAVVDTQARTATLYCNGTAVASSKANGTLTVAGSTLRIGRSASERYSGPFCLTSINGLIDDIVVWDEALSASEIAAMKPENEADLTIPAERFADDPLRPAFHGMPGANWTNESHGMTYSNGRYHVFFQKNGNGPYMARLHWGHISSENLYDWREEKIAIAPGAYYDIKGCWSGCVFSDEEISGGKPSILYTGVDYGRAVIAQASPKDDDLIEWEKKSGPVINGRPDGLSDDFRDPYFFRSESGAYIIVGSSKDGKGTTTLHSYNPTTKSWSNDGRIFFSATNASTGGSFWEMPNVTKIGDKWLFTATPLNTYRGVATLYWVGSINADGTFRPDRTTSSNVELSGFARDGYGLLSPTIFQHDGKTIALGIVPDKLPGQSNYDMGYAHAYSLPREWSLDASGNLCQKPYSGLEAMRCANGYSASDITLEGSLTLDGISGRAVEVMGEFTVGAGKYGFTLLDDGVTSVKVYYDGSTNEIVLDTRGVDRLINDSGVFDGYYHSTLPRQLAKGETVKLNVFLDHSMVDIFVNDMYASSVRVFANGKAVENVTAFSDSPNQVKSLKGWNLDAKSSGAGIAGVTVDEQGVELRAEAGTLSYANVETPAELAVYNISGAKVLEKRLEASEGCIPTNLQGIHLAVVSGRSGSVCRKVVF